MPREKSKWRPPRGERTNAEHRGGPTRTSDEGRSCGRSKGVGPSGCRQRPTGNRRRPWRQRSRSTSHADADRLLGGSGVSREAPAPFCERPEVKLLRPTRLESLWLPFSAACSVSPMDEHLQLKDRANAKVLRHEVRLMGPSRAGRLHSRTGLKRPKPRKRE